MTVRSSVPVVRSSARPAIDPDVGEVDGVRGVQEDRAGDAAVPPLVLVLDVGRVGPLDDAQGQRVRARAEGGRSGRTPRRGASPCRRRSRSPLRLTIRTLSAAPTWRTIRRPAHVGGDLELALVDARRVRARGSPAAGRRTASGRSCSAAGPRSRPSSRGPGRPPRPSSGPVASSGLGSSWKRHVPSSERRSGGRRCASGGGRCPSLRGRSTGRVTTTIVARGPPTRASDAPVRVRRPRF